MREMIRKRLFCMILNDEQKKHYEAFWAGDAYGRCCLNITAPAPKEGAAPAEPGEPAQKWEDARRRLERFIWDLERTAFFADAFPGFFVDFGPGNLTSMIGGTHKWAWDTVWFENEQVITDWETPPLPAVDKNSQMYRLVEELTSCMLNAGEGRFLTSITDFGGTYDIIAALRGTQTLLTDLYEYPDEIKAYAGKLRPVWMSYFNEQANRLLARQGGMTSWMPIWSNRPYCPLQCDFSAMISPDMFEEFILPDLRYQTENLPRSIYHWDGPGEIPHLKHLLSLPRLNAIQWTPGAGRENVGHECWFGLYEEIQAAGKGLVLLGMDPDNLENLLKHVSSKGLYIQTGAKDAAHAFELIRAAERLC